MAAGETEIEAAVSPPGLQRYDGLLASVVTVKFAEPPAQIVAELTLTAGKGFTVIVALPETVPSPQPPESDTVVNA